MVVVPHCRLLCANEQDGGGGRHRCRGASAGAGLLDFKAAASHVGRGRGRAYPRGNAEGGTAGVIRKRLASTIRSPFTGTSATLRSLFSLGPSPTCSP